MPHFDENGRDTVICQVCVRIVTEATWRPDITGHKSAGNVCNRCLANHQQKPVGLVEYCSQESGFPVGSPELTKYINRYYGNG